MWVRYVVFLAVVLSAALLVLAVIRAQARLAGRGVEESPDAQHEASLKAARQQLKKAQRGHQKRVRAAEKQARRAGEDPVVVKVGPVELRPLTITVRGREHPLTQETTFTLDVQGEVRSHTDAQGKVVRSDDREVFLTLTDPAWGDVVKLRPADLEGAHRLVVAGEAATRNLAAAQADRDARVERAQAELDQVRADTREVDAARLTLEDLEGAPPRAIDLPRPPPGGPDEGEDPDEPDRRDGPA